jgi:hypothetical protein
MSNTNFESCALDANGGLKPASAITWFNDVDNDIPMATVSPPVTASSSSSLLAQSTLNNFVYLTSSGKVPTSLVAGAHRSGCAIKPSAKICDTVPSISSVQAKRSAVNLSTATTCKCISAPADMDIDTSYDTVNGDDKMPDLQDCSDDDNNNEDACLTEEEFDQNQELADAMSYLSV